MAESTGAPNGSIRRRCSYSRTSAGGGEIVALLAQGHSRQDIACMRGVSVQTVTSQLRTIFQKASVNREAQLVSIARAVVEMAGR